VEVSLVRRGLGAGFAGSVRSQIPGRAVSRLTVELLDPLGVVATADTGADGEFSFEGLTSGVYHLRLTGDDWKMGIFGLTA